MFRVATWVGVITLGVAVWLTLVFPREMGPLPSGIKTPIIAFELARSTAEVETMFGPVGSSERVAWTRAMDAGNQQDVVFLVVYGLFFLFFSRGLVELGGRSAGFGRVIALMPSVMDAIENMQLLAITQKVAAYDKDYASELSSLALFTWAKWIGIALIFASWVPALWARGKIGRVTALLAVGTCASTLAAFFTRGVAAELMALGVGLTVLAALTFAFRSSRA
jgi:hypothetical protein